MLKRAFEADVSIGSGSTAKHVKTRGDISYEESYTEIEVKNAASNDVRYIPGMRATNFQMTVQAGTDPEDAADYDAYETLLGYYESGEVFALTFTSPGGLTRTKNFVITQWNDSDPIDGLNEATITLKIAAADAGDKFFGTESSGGGSGGGSGAT